MIKSIRVAAGAAAIVFTACTVEKKQDAAVSDTAASIALPAPAPVAPPPPAPVIDSPKTSSTKPRVTSKKPTAGGERDSAFEPVMVIGADGKTHPVKK
ncbi:MAG TPA: hypothetical protein VNC11_01910 [Gemmatimonadaceae bacterium]|nr:hypothetical protein [Gemmatimonadaceae bacterium]